MNLIKLQKMLKLAIKAQSWGMVETVEKQLFRENVLSNFICEQDISCLRSFFKSSDKTKVDFINLFYYGTIDKKNFLNANFDRLDEIIDILYKYIKDYDDRNGREKRKIKLKQFFKSKENLAIHCKTKEDAIKLCKAFDKIGKRWCDGTRYTENNCWYVKKENTCYSNKYLYCSIDYYKEHGYKIYEVEDVAFLPEE